MILSSSPISILEFDTLVIEKVVGAVAATRVSDSLLIHSSSSLALSVRVLDFSRVCCGLSLDLKNLVDLLLCHTRRGVSVERGGR